MTIDDVMKSLGDFIKTLVLCPIIKGQHNNVPMPKGEFILMTQKGQDRLAFNEVTYNGIDNRTLTRFTKYDIQLDFYGVGSGDRAGAVETAFFDAYACEFFGENIQPLYCSNAIQMPLVNGEQNYEERWTLTASLEANLDVVIGQQSANSLTVVPVNVEATYK